MYKNKVIIFDFDGTLADTMPVYIDLFYKHRKKFNLKNVTREQIDELRNLHLKDFINYFEISKFKLLRMTRLVKKDSYDYISKIRINQDLRKLLKELNEKNYIIGLLSSNSLKNINIFLEKNGIHSYFTFIKSGVYVFGKARAIRSTIKKHNLGNLKIFYIGDEVRDVDACKKIQKYDLSSIAICWGANNLQALKEAKPDFLVTEVNQLREVLIN